MTLIFESRNIDGLRVKHQWKSPEAFLGDWNSKDPSIGDNEILLVTFGGAVLYCSIGNKSKQYDDTVRTSEVADWFDTNDCDFTAPISSSDTCSEMEKYSWSFNEDSERWLNVADSIDNCIRQAKKEADNEDTVYIGENTAFVPSVDAETVLDSLQEQASDFAGYLGEDWDAYDYKTMRPELEELSNELTAVVIAWLKKNGREPHFYQVSNVRPSPLF